MWRSTGRVGIWRFPLCLPEGSPLPGPALKGKPACSGPGQETDHHTPNVHLGSYRCLPWNGGAGSQKPGPLSGPLGCLQGSRGTPVKDPATGTNWTCLCILAAPASLHLLEGGSLEAEPGEEEGEREGVLTPLTFSIQNSGQADAGATASITTALPAPSGIIPEGSVAWLPVCEG